MKPIIIGLIILIIFIVCCTSSKFNSTSASSKFNSTKTSTTSASSKYDSIDNNTVLIFYAPWCGHCKKSMGEFTKATEDPNAKVILVNSDDPSAKMLVEKYSIKGYPTIIKGDGTVYDGDRRAQDIVDFANGK